MGAVGGRKDSILGGNGRWNLNCEVNGRRNDAIAQRGTNATRLARGNRYTQSLSRPNSQAVRNRSIKKTRHMEPGRSCTGNVTVK